MSKTQIIDNAIIFTICLIGYIGIASLIKGNDKLNKEYIILATENTYLQGYKAGLMGLDRDSVWIEVSKDYRK